MCGRELAFFPYAHVVSPLFFDLLQLPPLAPNIIWLSNHQGAVLFFFFLLLISLLSSDLQWHHEEGNFFLEYV
jgi:hypothetical protein